MANPETCEFCGKPMAREREYNAMSQIATDKWCWSYFGVYHGRSYLCKQRKDRVAELKREIELVEQPWRAERMKR